MIEGVKVTLLKKFRDELCQVSTVTTDHSSGQYDVETKPPANES